MEVYDLVFFSTNSSLFSLNPVADTKETFNDLPAGSAVFQRQPDLPRRMWIQLAGFELKRRFFKTMTVTGGVAENGIELAFFIFQRVSRRRTARSARKIRIVL